MVIASLAAAWSAACTGAVGGTGNPASEKPPRNQGDGDNGGENSGGGDVPAVAENLGTGTGEAQDFAGPMPLRRLSRDEYDRTLRDLLGDTSRPGRALPDDSNGATFAAPGVVGTAEINLLFDAAATIADAAVARGAKAFGCDPSTDACITGWLPGFAKRAYRRPVTAEETAGLNALYVKAKGELKFTPAQAASFVLQGILNSPWFLYHWELGGASAQATGSGASTSVALTAYERASRLSYFLWGTMPDDGLFKAAESGGLDGPTGVATQARRLLADAKAGDALETFHRQWLSLGTASDHAPDSFAGAAAAETRAFVGYVFGDGGGKLETLLTSNTVFANQALAPAYGLTDVTGPGLVRREIDAKRRFGILTQANFLSAHGSGADSHPVKRGVEIVRKVLCLDLPAPPAVVEPVKAAAPGVSTRERFEVHQQNECAKACHGLIDPVGFAFEHYDGAGRWRDTDGGKPVNASGTLQLPLGGETSFTSIADLSVKLANSEDVRTCVTNQWASFALGRPAGKDEAGSLAAAYQVFQSSDYDVRELLVALTGTKTFLNRKPASGEVLR